MQISNRRAPGLLNPLVGSTGIRFLGDGRGLARKQGPQRRRHYRTVQLVMDTATGDTVRQTAEIQIVDALMCRFNAPGTAGIKPVA